MKAKMFLGMLLTAFFAVAGMTSCSSNDDDVKEDAVKDIIMEVSNTVTVGHPTTNNPTGEYMNVKEKGTDKWFELAMGRIEGFEFVPGHKYELKVRKTRIGDRYVDGSMYAYKLLQIISDTMVCEPDDSEDTDVKSEADIEYQDLCPIEKYSISKEYIVDKNGNIHYGDGSAAPSYNNARIWLENILDKGDPNWVKFNSVPYQASYSYVLSPLTDKIRLVSNDSHGPMFKDVIPESEFINITQSLKSGEELHYALILANVQKKGLQKVEFTVKLFYGF